MPCIILLLRHLPKPSNYQPTHIFCCLSEQFLSIISGSRRTYIYIFKNIFTYRHIPHIILTTQTFLIKLHWLPIKQRIEYKLLLLTFRSLHGLAASYLSDLLIRYEPTRALRSADAHLLEVPRCRLLTQGEKAFSSAAPRLWNNLPLAMRATDSLSSFKKQLKTLLFKKAFSL